ncbi:hypothetical protein AURDEDRAFT_123864 [Auricularia subglabra TFB-10046 SS5]|nr:hypothetical protein AURDEDRAFT_123864 [Auricularia subglabra TFB-10046 SS5]
MTLGASIGGAAAAALLLLLAACWALFAWRRRHRPHAAENLPGHGVTCYYPRREPIVAREPPNKLRLWDVAEKMSCGPQEPNNIRTPNLGLGSDANAAADVEDNELGDTTHLRTQLECLRAANAKALQEIAVLRRFAEPPPYTDSSQRGGRAS